MEDKPIRLTKGQRKRLYHCNVGVGIVAFKSGDNEITEVEFYIGRDGHLRRVRDGSLLLPLQVHDD